MSRPSRRQFVQSLAAASVLGPTIISSSGRAAANDRINIGFIGVGTMGRGHIGRFSRYSDVQLVAVCDVVTERRDSAKKTIEDYYAKHKKNGDFKGCQTYLDFRELLARNDLDAVIISTPDHWHAIPCILAAQAKKHIYCEKPLTLTIAEGRKIVEAAQKNDIIFQTGSQQRSEFGGKFRTAVELVRNGRIGQIKTVRVGVGAPPDPCNLAEEPIPEGTDWDRWLGPAPQRGYNSILCPKGVHKHFPAWRNYREYAGGGLADFGAHHFDIAQWGLDMDNTGPVKIEPPDGAAKTGLKFTYANGIEMFHGGPGGATFEGTDGKIHVDRGVLESRPEEIVKQPIGPNDKRVYRSDEHGRNWIECIRSKKQPICNAEVGHRTATICHLANIGYELRRPLQWDPSKELFAGPGAEEANKLVSRPERSPWTL